MVYNNDMIIQHLKEHGIRPSNIRIKVLNFLFNQRIHPTVDEIYKDLLGEIPTLSKTSIYNTLEIFLEKNIVKPIVFQEKELRYDINTNLHGHFKCEKCEKVYDFPLPADIFTKSNLEGFTIKGENIYVYGICKDCNK